MFGVLMGVLLGFSGMSLPRTFFGGILRFLGFWWFSVCLQSSLSCLTQQRLSQEKVFHPSKNQLDIGLSEHRTGLRGDVQNSNLNYHLSAEILNVKPS